MVTAVRGAIQIEADDSSLISRSVVKLIETIVAENKIAEGDIVSIMFSQTKDITAINPATALRETGFAGVPLFCSQEPEYSGSMPRIVRVLITYNLDGKKDPTPVYLGGAEKLRADLFDKS